MCAARLLLARPVEGTVGERERVTHIVPLPEGPDRPVRVRACCGQDFGPGELELLDRVSGMPCESCLRRAQVEQHSRGLSATDDIFTRLAAIESAVVAINGRVDELSALLRRVVEQRTGSSSAGSTSGER